MKFKLRLGDIRLRQSRTYATSPLRRSMANQNKPTMNQNQSIEQTIQEIFDTPNYNSDGSESRVEEFGTLRRQN